MVPCLWNDIDDEDDIDEQDIVTVIFNITVYSSEIQGRMALVLEVLAVGYDEKETGNEPNYIQKLCCSNCTVLSEPRLSFSRSRWLRDLAWVCGRLFPGIAASNLTGGWLSLVNVVCCKVEGYAMCRTLVQWSTTEFMCVN